MSAARITIVAAAAGAIAGAAAALFLVRPEVGQDLTDDQYYTALFGEEDGSR